MHSLVTLRVPFRVRTLLNELLPPHPPSRPNILALEVGSRHVSSLNWCWHAARSFLNKVESLAKPGYVPSNEEILKVRDPTRTIETIDFQANKAKFRVIDVGGQRMERPKWNLTGTWLPLPVQPVTMRQCSVLTVLPHPKTPCKPSPLTGEITAVIFVCALTEYNQVLREDIKQNRYATPSAQLQSWMRARLLGVRKYRV